MTYSPPPTGTPQAPSAPIGPTLLWGITGFFSLGPLLISAMLFDAPGSEKNKLLWLVVASMASYPLLCGVSVVGGWIAYSVGTAGRTRRVLALLPLLSVGLVVVSIGLWMGLCGGQTRCQ